MTARRIFTWLTAALILKVACVAILNYRDYFPPNFEVDFLRGRESYFWGSYGVAFHVHILSGPVSLTLGLVLLSERFRRRFPKWHRRLGRIQVLDVLLLVAPSGLWMGRHADGGPIAVWGFMVLAIATGSCVALAWRAAMQRRFSAHRLWMQRGFLLLCSAVVTRMIGGLVSVTGFHAPWIAPLAAWVSWFAPLAVFEGSRAVERLLSLFARPNQTHDGRMTTPIPRTSSLA